jgi:hypothetical protein
LDYSEERLRCERFEAKPKRVIMAPNFRDWVDALGDAEVARRYNDIADRIRDGRLLATRTYRRGIERDEDALLQEDGIKHLHLDNGGGDQLLFCVEYDDAVVFLEINSHRHFGTEPPGSVLLSLHRACLEREDQDASERRKGRLSDKIAAIGRGLLRRRSASERRERAESAPRETDE